MKTSIKMWAEDDRPREKMQMKGSKALSDAEILAIIIGSGTRYYTAVELAQHILRENNNSLMQLARKSLTDLCQLPGIGLAKAVGIQAAFELGRRKKEQEPTRRQRILTGEHSSLIFEPYLTNLNHEEFYVLYLDRANYFIKLQRVSIGGVHASIADGKIIFREALMLRASNIILAHNHPSGNRQPSKQDIALTKRLRDFGKLVDLQVIDHLIITDNGYFSFAEKNVI